MSSSSNSSAVTRYNSGPCQKDEEAIFDDSTIKHLYKTSIRMCLNCGKRESDDVCFRVEGAEEESNKPQFVVCSKCGVADYCSAECQSKHWNKEGGDGHKVKCLRNADSSNKKSMKKKKKKKVPMATLFETMSPKDKVTHFKNQFQPLLSPLAVWHFYRFTGTDYGRSSWLGTTHVLCIELKETTHKEAASPLYIHEVYLQKIVNQSPKLKLMLVMTGQTMPSNIGPHDATGFIKLKLYNSEDEDSFEIHPNLFQDIFKGTFVDAQIAQAGKTMQRKQYEHRADLVHQQINAMAKGTAPSSLKAASKGKGRKVR
uniref:MYND-type domain-containing protein n=1 Tax=Grammatophora oceanica TaxID=210454 RepID=A0A7S1UZY6_9STRA|mmetsp:Transcript_31737/g.47150  ORF Transcript_31737/g.47150 Transcript_31737/m.47150 type:complete len:314 (+) Transcript_31737:160-1101(+)|eukprot:CAMPEP_0194029874 /NCGR_PEP_ID=MMETSP0009_2-20130614/3502_1 /TAXON_ID=210454 /ORGANISM="Grammatophora oceanica, Strain CCMP 410" /LENGTH=313 /DNA_ID=CAMNT_0038669669 /DNA_START=133 /DNA_END=1074 /DNA_ORIENTATION=+